MDGLCFEDLDLFGRELDDPLEELLQDVVHMLLESYRSNPDDPDRCIGIDDMLSGPNDPTLADRIESRLTEDDRVSGARATISPSNTVANGIRIELEIQANQRALGITIEFDGGGNVRRILR